MKWDAEHEMADMSDDLTQCGFCGFYYKPEIEEIGIQNQVKLNLGCPFCNGNAYTKHVYRDPHGNIPITVSN